VNLKLEGILGGMFGDKVVNHFIGGDQQRTQGGDCRDATPPPTKSPRPNLKNTDFVNIMISNV
jgi:hypothetical protein